MAGAAGQAWFVGGAQVPAVSVGAVIMAHPQRGEMAERIRSQLDRDVPIQYDANPVPSSDPAQRWANGAAAWRQIDAGCDWGLVLQDDVVVCRDLLAGLETALTHVPSESVVSLYLGRRRYLRTTGIDRAGHAAWVVMAGLTSGQGIAVPTRTIDDMLAWCQRNGPSNYDIRIGAYYEKVLRWPAWYTFPSLVEHARVPSLIGHADGRVAYRFAGAGTSAADIDWSAGVFEAAQPRKR